jgi:hypothetical protein
MNPLHEATVTTLQGASADGRAMSPLLKLSAEAKFLQRHYREGPCVDGSELAREVFHVADPVGCSHVFGLICTVHMTAGHNALRGSGPGQTPHSTMHWPLRVVLIADRPALHYVLFALPTFAYAAVGVYLSCRQCDGLLVAFAPRNLTPMILMA